MVNDEWWMSLRSVVSILNIKLKEYLKSTFDIRHLSFHSIP